MRKAAATKARIVRVTFAGPSPIKRPAAVAVDV
jgi:hypothetical protein